MKGLKKILTGILAGAMALSITLTAGTAMTAKADGDGTTITVNNAIAGQEYSAYKVFDYIPAINEILYRSPKCTVGSTCFLLQFGFFDPILCKRKL